MVRCGGEIALFEGRDIVCTAQVDVNSNGVFHRTPCWPEPTVAGGTISHGMFLA